MKTIIISPYSKNIPGVKKNPKNYPYWKEVVKLLRKEGYYTVQIGVSGQDEESIGADKEIYDSPHENLLNLVRESDTWICVDNFFHHMCSHTDKSGVVIFGQSDPEIFGYKHNINLLKSRFYLREHQFELWSMVKYKANCFVSPNDVVIAVKRILKNS